MGRSEVGVSHTVHLLVLFHLTFPHDQLEESNEKIAVLEKVKCIMSSSRKGGPCV